MISLKYEDMQKLELLGAMFERLPYDDLKQMVEADEIVSRLKGGPAISDNILTRLYNEHNSNYTDLLALRSEVMTLRGDLQTLIKAVNDRVFMAPYDANFQALKGRYGVY